MNTDPPTYRAVTAADGAGVQLVPAGRACVVVKLVVEGASGSGVRLRKTSSGGATLCAMVAKTLQWARAPFKRRHVIRSHDGLYVERLFNPTRVSVWYLEGSL